jgi:hypothetical protein
MGQEQGLAPHTGGGERRLGAGMTATDDYNIIVINKLHIKQELVRGANDTGKAEPKEVVSRETHPMLRCSMF